MPRKKPTPFPPWQSDKADGIEKRYIRLGNSQMLHPVVVSLRPMTFKIYCYMLLESGGKQIFEFPHAKYIKIVSKRGFQLALMELQSAGLVEVAEKNANLRKPNKYRFLSDWKSP